MGNRDNFALDWIRGELESTLDQARGALESYAEGGREETRLRSCLTSLHQVHGTLRMLELEGVVLLADHMEQTAQSLLNGSIQEATGAEQTLMQCILQLPAFIEEVQSGVTEDLPLVMPYVNELRTCCGLTPMELTPAVSAEFTSEEAAVAMRRFRSIKGADKATRVRAAYQQVLLSVLKGGASTQTVTTLGKVAIGLQRICEGAPIATLWKALEHFANGYQSDPAKMSSEAVRDLRRVDAEMKKLSTQGAEVLADPVPVELVRDLLRAAEAHGVRHEEITDLRSSVQTPNAPRMKPREALEQAAEVLAEDVAAVRDHFDLFARGKDRELDALVELTAPLDGICSTLSVLGDDRGADLLRRQRALVLALNDDEEIDEELILGIASALVQTEQGLTGSGEIDSADDALADAALNDAQVAVLQEARGGIDQVKQSIVDYVSSKWNAEYLATAPEVLTAVQGALKMIPLPRAAELLGDCGSYVSDQLLAGHRPDWQELDAFADALGGVDYYLERMFETSRVPNDEALDLTEDSLNRLAGLSNAQATESAEQAGAEPSQHTSDESPQGADPQAGDSALTAMLGASPDELAFVATDDEQPAESGLDDDAPAEANLDSETNPEGLGSDLELVELASDENDTAADSSAGENDAQDGIQEEEQASALSLVPETIAENAGDDASDSIDTSQTAFLAEPEEDSPPDRNAGNIAGAALSAAGVAALGAAAAGVVDSSVDSSVAASDATLQSADAARSSQPPANDPPANESPAFTPEPVDPEIVEIFVEEVDEVLEAIESQMPNWSQDLSAAEPLGEIRRSFHTLKGSGRIVGANQIGELGWALENMLNRVLDNTIEANEDHLFLVSHACGIVPQLRKDFAEGVASERPELVELLEQIDVLASGGSLSSSLAQASPGGASADATELDEEDFPIWDDPDAEHSDSTDQTGSNDETRPPSVGVPSFLDQSSDNDIDMPASEGALFASEMQEHLEVLSSNVRDSLQEDKLELDGQFTRALHTIAGSAATAGESGVVSIAEPLQDVCSAVLRERGGVLEGECLAFTREGVYALQRLLDLESPDSSPADDSELFAAEAERLLVDLSAGEDAPASLLEMAETSILLDAREFLDGWRFGSLDLVKAEQMNSALTHVVQRAHSDEFAELAEYLLLAHSQFADGSLNEDQHFALVAAHDDLLVQLDALAADQVASLAPDSVQRLQDLLAERQNRKAESASDTVADADAAEQTPNQAPDQVTEQVTDNVNPDNVDIEELDDDAQEALAYELDESDAFDLGALDDDVFAVDDAPGELLADSESSDSESAQTDDAEGGLSAGLLAGAAAAAGAIGATGAALAAEEPTANDAASTIPETPTADVGIADTQEEDPVDPELLAIFFEEADEILEDFDHNLQSWSGDRDNGEHLDNLLRGLHTLKGGARLAGLGPLGDITHDYESELIGLQNTSQTLTDTQFDAIQDRYDELVESLTRARRSDADPADVADTEAHSDPEPQLTQTPADAQAVETVEPEVSDPSVDADDVGQDFDSDVEAAFEAETLADEAQQRLNSEAPEQSQDEEPPILDQSVVPPVVVPAVPSLPTPATQPAAKVEDDRSRTSQEMVRVSAPLLENLVNLAGESSIVRARVEQGISDFGGALEEMETTIERVREQLRRLEIETEARVSSRIERVGAPADEEFDPLEMDRYSQLQQLTRSLTESATDMMDLKETLRYRARESETLLLQQARLNTELQEGLMRTRMVPFSRLLPRLRRIVRQVSRDLGKQVEFEAYNAEGELDRNVLERMVPPLEHMLRNAIDHGIETEEQRQNFGKSNIGRIDLKLSREGGDVVIEIADDGAGIDVETVRAKAVERGLMAPEAPLSDDEILEFVLAPGFSTAKSLTQISGRGVGMDVVHSEVKQLGGRINISSVPGRGTTFTVRLPFTVSVNRALMVTLGDDQYAIPLNTIEGIVLLPSEDLSHHSGPEGAPLEYAGVPYRVRYLGSYLGREYVAHGDQDTVPVVLVRSGDQAVAVHVDDVQGSREIVVKSLGPQFAGVGGISGATILGDGSVVIILDLLSLMRSSSPGQPGEIQPLDKADEERLVLVVDDSVTVRKVTSRLLERQGMNVMTAKDGVEAVSVLQERMPDIVLLDIEMPRMDGFEVARQVRRDERLAHLPIVMISSRTGDKHTERAKELGVNRFLGKPFQENELLEVIDELVVGR